jgi:hypothetical protein
MNTEQTQGLIQVRNKFVANHDNLASIEPGTVHTKLDRLTLSELRYLSSFAATVRSSVVDLNLSEDQVAEDTSPVYDIAQASRLAGRAIQSLEGSFSTVKKAFQEELFSGFRLESVMDPNYAQIYLDVGLSLDAVTLKFLREFDVKVQAVKVIDEILGHLGFKELQKMYDPNGPALKLDRLMEVGFEGMKDGPNPALFEALASRVIDSVTESFYGVTGFVKKGNVRLKLAAPNDIGTTNLLPNMMLVVEIGVRPSSFTLSSATEEYFPNFPQARQRADQVSETVLLTKFIKEFQSNETGGLKFKVEIAVYEKTATFVSAYGKVSVRPAGGGPVKLKLV